MKPGGLPGLQYSGGNLDYTKKKFGRKSKCLVIFEDSNTCRRQAGSLLGDQKD